jgi:CCR4-NOT transcription complex subunit 7/8
MMMSGLVLNDEVKWVSFHSSYDFGYLLKTLTCTDLPGDETAFLDLLRTFFPCIYDVKYMMTAVEGMYGGLNALADALQVERIGPMHQAGSDSLLTAQTYFALIKKHLNGYCDASKFCGELFGLGTNHTKYKAKPYGGGNPSGTMNGLSSMMSAVSANMSSNNLGTMSMGIAGLQYGSAIHYGPNGSMVNGGLHHGAGSSYTMFDESQHLSEGY